MVSSPPSLNLPTLAPGWDWQTWQGMPYLTCSLLENWHHGFFTRQFWPRTPEEFVAILQPDAEVYRLKQVHGNQVLTPQEINTALAQDSEASLVPGDGIVNEQAHQAVWVATADCTPVLIGDIHTGQVAAIHAGWRGTAKKIVPEAIKRLVAHGSSTQDLRIAMGPAISGEVYQVSEQVGAEVGATVISNAESISIEDILAQLQELSDAPILQDSEPGKVRLDVRRINALQIEQLGISVEQVTIAPICTYQQPDYLFSYRRRREKKVQWSGIVSN